LPSLVPCASRWRFLSDLLVEELRNCTSCWITCWQKVLCHWLQDDFFDPHRFWRDLKRFLEISRVNFIQVSHIMFQHIATKYVAMLDGTYMTVASVASVACHQDGFNSVCTLPAGCIFDDTSLGDTKPVVLPCCPCHCGTALHCALRNARCQLDLYDLDFVIDVTINPPSSRLSAVLQCYSATVLHTEISTVGPKTSQVTWRPSGAQKLWRSMWHDVTGVLEPVGTSCCCWIPRPWVATSWQIMDVAEETCAAWREDLGQGLDLKWFKYVRICVNLPFGSNWSNSWSNS
jgi:hypothetical protein